MHASGPFDKRAMNNFAVSQSDPFGGPFNGQLGRTALVNELLAAFPFLAISAFRRRTCGSAMAEHGGENAQNPILHNAGVCAVTCQLCAWERGNR